jgi:hypothetical protein
MLAVLALLGSPLAVLTAVASPPITGSAAATTQAGYRLLGGDGGVFAFGTAFYGAPASDPTRCPVNPPGRSMPHGSCWSIAATADGGGYYVLNAYRGDVFTYGDAVSYGTSVTGVDQLGPEFAPTALQIAPTPDGLGYWILLVGGSGLASVKAFGDAHSFGDETTAGLAHNGAPVALVGTADGKGYWIVDSDGGVFAFGDATFDGSMGGHPLNAPIVGMARTAKGGGYWLVAADGGVFAFGDAAFGGSLGALHLSAPIVGMAANPGGGYWLVGADGGVFALGGAPFDGSMGGRTLAQPVVAITG